MTISTGVRGKKFKRRQQSDSAVDQSLLCRNSLCVGWNDNNLHNSYNAHQRQQACGNCVELHGCHLVPPANLLVFIAKNWKNSTKFVCVLPPVSLHEPICVSCCHRYASDSLELELIVRMVVCPHKYMHWLAIFLFLLF